MIKEPMCACDFNEKYAKFPLVVLPKVDGVRGYCNDGGQFLARSGMPYANRYVANYFSRPELIGLDCETVAELITHPDLCRLTTSALNSIEGEPFVQLWVFDWYDEQVAHCGYLTRLEWAHDKVTELGDAFPDLRNHLRAMPYKVVQNKAELDAAIKEYEDAGYEGTIVRDPNGMYKQGRATAKEMTYGRVKAWMHDEIVITGVIEGQTNMNPQEQDAFGKAKRSTHKENMIGNGMVGTIVGTLVKDVVIGKKVFPAGKVVNMSPGKMTDAEAGHYFTHQDQIIGRIAKGKHFPKGVKDTLRFFTFQTFRMPEDM